MSRNELYYRGLTIAKRLLELQDKHHWSDQEVKIAQQISDEGIPLHLHYLGWYTFFFTIDYILKAKLLLFFRLSSSHLIPRLP